MLFRSHGGFFHPQCDGAAPRFLQQCFAELLGLVIGKSQARASLNMTDSVLSVILYRVSFWFARGVEKNIRILTKNYFPLTHYFMKALRFLWQRTAPPKIKNAPPPNRNCTPLTDFYQNYGSLPAASCRTQTAHLTLCGVFFTPAPKRVFF